MHFLRTLFLALLSLFALAAYAATQPQKSVIITWPSDAPDHIIDAAREAILRAGGVITHEYKILRGFAATAAASAFETVGALSTEWPVLIEEDQIVNAWQGSS